MKRRRAATSKSFVVSARWMVTIRRAAASFALVGWAFTFLLVPALHLVRHRNDHVHRPDGSIVFNSTSGHGHSPGDAGHSHGDGIWHVHTPVLPWDLASAITRVVDATGPGTTAGAHGDHEHGGGGHGGSPAPYTHGAESAAHFGLAVLDAPVLGDVDGLDLARAPAAPSPVDQFVVRLLASGRSARGPPRG